MKMIPEFKCISYKHGSSLCHLGYQECIPQTLMGITLSIPWKLGAIVRSCSWCLTNGNHKLVNFSMSNPINREGEVLKYSLWILHFPDYFTKGLCSQYTCRHPINWFPVDNTLKGIISIPNSINSPFHYRCP